MFSTKCICKNSTVCKKEVTYNCYWSCYTGQACHRKVQSVNHKSITTGLPTISVNAARMNHQFMSKFVQPGTQFLCFFISYSVLRKVSLGKHNLCLTQDRARGTIIFDNAVLASLSWNTWRTSIAFCECFFCSCLVWEIPGPFDTMLCTWNNIWQCTMVLKLYIFLGLIP